MPNVTHSLKRCATCGTSKPLDEFHADRRRRDGRFPYCKACRIIRDGRTPQPPRRFETKREYDQDYRRRMSAAERTTRSRRQYLWTTYRMTVEDYDRMLSAQGGVCAICHQPESRSSSKFGNPGRLHVDHDHGCCDGSTSCGCCIRGLLCGHCNSAIGLLGDDPARIREALEYLQRWTEAPCPANVPTPGPTAKQRRPSATSTPPDPAPTATGPSTRRSTTPTPGPGPLTTSSPRTTADPTPSTTSALCAVDVTHDARTTYAQHVDTQPPSAKRLGHGER